MANRLVFGTAIDASGFAGGITQMERLAGLAGARLGSSFSSGFGHGGGAGGGISGIIRETLVIFRELGRGNLTRIPGSASLLFQYLGGLGLILQNTSAKAMAFAAAEGAMAQKMAIAAVVARDKATAALRDAEATMLDQEASLNYAAACDTEAAAAEKAALAQNQKAAAVARSAEIQAAGARTTLGPLAWWGIGLLAVGVAAYVLIRHIRTLGQEEQNVKDLTDFTTRSFQDQAKAIRDATEAHQAEIDRLNQLTAAEGNARDAIEETLKMMKERARYEQELAGAQGKSKAEIAQMEIKAEKDQLNYITLQTLALRRKIEAEKADESAVSDRLDAFNSGSGPNSAARMKSANTAADSAAAVVDAIQKYMAKNPLISYNTGNIQVIGPGQYVNETKTRPIGNEDVVDVKVGEKEYTMSLAAAKAAYDKDAAEVTRLAAVQKQITDLLTQKKKLTDDDVAQLKKLQDEQQDLEDDLKLKQEFLSKIAGAQSSIGAIGGGDSLTRVGNFLGSARGKVDSLAQEHVKIARQSLGHLKSIDTKTTAHHAGAGNAVTFGVS